ncbi:YciI family protein [Thalassotalea ganghwensis]
MIATNLVAIILPSNVKSEKNMFLVNMTFVDVDKITPELTNAHRDYLAKQYQQNKLMFGGRKVPRTGGILISQHESRHALEHVLQADPFVNSGAVNYTITEFVPVMASEQYQSLIV